MTFELENVVPWGRSFDEYVAMFALTERDLGRRILDCGGGPAAFNAVAAARGMDVTSLYPIYEFGADEIERRIDATAAGIAEKLRANASVFVWTHFEDADDVVTTRMAAMRTFLGDFAAADADNRYIAGALPDLPFADARFELALCSHFLFLYSEQHGFEFHIASIVELVRTAGEVRVFPLLELGSARSRHLAGVIEDLRERGLSARVVPVSYEFQRGGNEMLVIV
jgi:SAM-dependent methyltransferase